MSVSRADDRPPSRTLGEAIRRAREGAGLSLREVAQLVGVSATHLSDVERGNRFTRHDVLVSIAKAVGVKVATLERYDERVPVERLVARGRVQLALGPALRRFLDSGLTGEDLAAWVETENRRRKS